MKINELEDLAARNGFYLSELTDIDRAIAKRLDGAEELWNARFVLEDMEDDEADYACFKTEVGMRAFLTAFPDK